MRLVDVDWYLAIKFLRNQWSKKCVNFYEVTPGVTWTHPQWWGSFYYKSYYLYKKKSNLNPSYNDMYMYIYIFILYIFLNLAVFYVDSKFEISHCMLLTLL